MLIGSLKSSLVGAQCFSHVTSGKDVQPYKTLYDSVQSRIRFRDEVVLIDYVVMHSDHDEGMAYFQLKTSKCGLRFKFFITGAKLLGLAIASTSPGELIVRK